MKSRPALSSVFVRWGFLLIMLCMTIATTVNAQSTLALLDPAYDCNTRQLTFRTSGGDGSSVEYMAPGVTGWTTKAANVLDAATAADGSVTVVKLFARQGGKIVSRDFNIRQLCGSTGIIPPNKTGDIGSTDITLVDPSYDCTTRQLTFRTSGGNGSTVEYMAPGVTGWTTNAANVVEAGTAADGSVSVIKLFARQSGKIVSRDFNIRQLCGSTGIIPPNKTGDVATTNLTLVAPSYNCATRQITFQTSGGNGSTIEYMAPGVTGWTTNATSTVDAAAAADPATTTLTLFARQSGKIVSYKFNLKDSCK